MYEIETESHKIVILLEHPIKILKRMTFLLPIYLILAYACGVVIEAIVPLDYNPFIFIFIGGVLSAPRRLLVFDSGYLYHSAVNSLFVKRFGVKQVNYKNNVLLNLYDLYSPACSYGKLISKFSFSNAEGYYFEYPFFSLTDTSDVIMKYLQDFEINSIR